MNTPKNFFTLLGTFISILTSLGVTIHDGHVDQFVTRAAGNGHIFATYRPNTDDGGATNAGHISSHGLGSNQHAHADYNPLSHALSNTFSYQSPSIAPRRESHHKHLLREFEIGGRHAFDNACLPLLFD